MHNVRLCNNWLSFTKTSPIIFFSMNIVNDITSENTHVIIAKDNFFFLKITLF